MKSFKKFIIFAVFAGGIFLLMTLLAAPVQRVDKNELVAANIDRLRDDVNHQWDDVDGWNSEIYNGQMKRVAQSRAAGVIDPVAARSLTDLINRRAYDKSIAAMNRQFERAGCDRSILAHNAEGLHTIIDHEPSIARLPDVERALATYSLYGRIMAFNAMNLGLSPDFNYDNNSWSPSFPDYAKRIRARRDEMLGDKYFGRLSGINDIRAIYKTEDKLEAARQTYYDRLVAKIRNAYTDARERCKGVDGEIDNSERQRVRDRFVDLRNRAYDEFTPAANAAMSDIHRNVL